MAKKKKLVSQAEPLHRHSIHLPPPAPENGLSTQEAKRRAKAGYRNEPVAASQKSDGEIITDSIFTYFNLIFTVLAVCLLSVGDWKDLVFMLLVIANTAIGIIQQLRSKRTIEKLTVVAAAQVTVIRDGTPVKLSTDEIVSGDMVEFTTGDQIPADGPVVSGQIQVSEGLITGEADAITKHPGESLLSGSFVLSGRCRARMDKVGAEAYAAKLTLQAKEGRAPAKSEMMRSLDRLIRVIGVSLIPIGVALFYNQYFIQQLGFRQSIISMVAALIGMIPEGLFFLTSVALAVSVVRLARNKTLIHEMSAIETLARVDVLCVDKTGTITGGTMQLREVAPLDPAAYDKECIARVVGAFYHAAEADNDTSQALAEAFSIDPHWITEQVIPFTSATKWSAVTFSGEGTYAIGAPEAILGEEFAPLASRTQYFAKKGCRVLLLAQCDGVSESGFSGLIYPMALLVLENPIRPEAPPTFAAFQSRQVAVKVISGDNPVTVSAVAAQAGIEGAGEYIDARTLTDDRELAKAAQTYTVFGRVVPEQKRKIARALQREGHTVAMVGDGVNDVLALKDVDCGIAMASGSDAACQAAQLVLLDSDFSALPKVVAEGRRVINNIQRASALYLVKNIFSFFLAIITLFADFPYPFVPVQLTLISALTIGIPSFLLALEPNHDPVKGKFMHNVLRRAFPGGLTVIIVTLFAEVFTYVLPLSLEELSTICVVLAAINGLAVIFYVARPLNRLHTTMLFALSAAMALAMATMGEAFSLSPLSFPAWLVMVVLGLLVIPVMFTIERGFDAISYLFSRNRERRKRRKSARAAFRKHHRR